MSLCPTPAAKTKTDYTSPGALILTPPDAKYEICEGGTTSVITDPGTIVTETVCCPSPGPAGPPGPAGQLMLKYDGVELGNITSLDVKGMGLLPEIVGTDGFLSTTAMVWKGDWAEGIAYKKYDVVRNASDGNAYSCVEDHTSSASDIPAGDGGFYWDPITDVNQAQMAPADKTFLDSLRENVIDWWNAATIGERLLGIVVGAGVIYAGSKILDMFTQTGAGDGQADSRYTGTPGYNGAFTPPTLPQVVGSLMEFGGYTSGEYDTSLLPTSQVHFTLSSTISVRTLLQQLALVYQFDIVPSGGTVKFVPKYQLPVRTLTAYDFGHVITEGDITVPKAPYTAKRMQGIDLPRSVALKYYSAELDYNPFVQTSTLETFEEGQDVSLDVPLTLIDADAKRISETSMVNAHVEQQQYTFTTDYYNIDLEPGDVINIPLDSGGTTTVRIIQIDEVDDGILEFTVARADNNTETWTVSNIPQVLPPTQTTNVVSTIGYSQTLFLEVPPLSPTETTPRIKAVIHGYAAPGWPGAIVYRSTDGGLTYNPLVNSSNTSTIGLVASPTLNSNVNYHVWDTTSTVTVQLKQGTLLSSTDIDVQNGKNWCMVGEEVIGFVNATLVSPGTYQLSRLLRGRQGSEQKCTTHVNNELFVLLDNTLVDIGFTQAELAQTMKYKTVTVGSDLSKVDAEDVKPYALNMRPWAPAQLTAVREANDDWTITWKERPRYNNHLQDYSEVIHDADWAGFGVTVYSGATIKHSHMTVDPYYTYTAAQQITDFGSVQSTLNVSVTQLSTIVGGGYASTITV